MGEGEEEGEGEVQGVQRDMKEGSRERLGRTTREGGMRGRGIEGGGKSTEERQMHAEREEEEDEGKEV